MAFQNQNAKTKSKTTEEATEKQYIHDVNTLQSKSIDVLQQKYIQDGATLFRLDGQCAALDLTGSALLALYGAAQKSSAGGIGFANQGSLSADVSEAAGKTAGLRQVFAAYAEQVQREDQARLDEVSAKIAAIGTVTLKSDGKIKAAEDAFAKLPEHLKGNAAVGDKIKAARAELAKLTGDIEDQKRLKAVQAALDAVGTVTLKSGDAVTAAEHAFAALPSHLKQQALRERVEAARAQLKALLQKWASKQELRAAKREKRRNKRSQRRYALRAVVKPLMLFVVSAAALALIFIFLVKPIGTFLYNIGWAWNLVRFPGEDSLFHISNWIMMIPLAVYLIVLIVKVFLWLLLYAVPVGIILSPALFILIKISRYRFRRKFRTARGFVIFLAVLFIICNVGGAVGTAVYTAHDKTHNIAGNFTAYKPGDTVYLGSYAQSADGKASPIKWTVCAVDAESIRLISAKILDVKRPGEVMVWLNGAFYEEAFSQSEKDIIEAAGIFYEDSLGQGVGSTGNNVGLYDSTFTLNFKADEAKKVTDYGTVYPWHQAKGTAYAYAQGLLADEGLYYTKSGDRKNDSPAKGYSEWLYDANGEINVYTADGNSVKPENKAYGVRPAVVIDTEKVGYVPAARMDIAVKKAPSDGYVKNENGIFLLRDKSITLTVDLSPENATYKAVEWTHTGKSSSTTLGGQGSTVDEKGKFKAVSAGTFTVTATLKANESITASIKITVMSQYEWDQAGF